MIVNSIIIIVIQFLKFCYVRLCSKVYFHPFSVYVHYLPVWCIVCCVAGGFRSRGPSSRRIKSK
ncbi:MAG: hypothetical protein ACRC1M_05450 [Methanobacteriaceae archaeon]